MKLIKCGHCGRPYYDDSETCPYCGRVPGSSPQTADAEQEATSNSTDGAAQAAPVPDTTPSDSQPEKANPQPAETITPVADTDNVADAAPTSLRAESIAAAVASGPLTNSDDGESSPLSDPNLVETILPPRRRHPWLWLLLILLLATIAAAAYIYRDTLKQIITSLIS